MKSKIMDNYGQETLCRFEEIRDNGTFTTYKTTILLTKDEFLLAFNTWVRGKENENI